MLRTLSPTEQHGVALGFIMREQREVAAAKPVSPGETPRKEYLTLRVSNYMGRKNETLLRWLVELDTAVMARRLVDPLAKVAFAMSCFGGRARLWVYGRRLTDSTCFSTYESFKEELKLAFEPPQNEFRSRAEFLDLLESRGKHDVHAYAQRARYLVSNVVTDPMDEATKVVTTDYPSTLEAAITLAMQEEFSLRQAKLHMSVPRPPRPAAKTEGPYVGNRPAVGSKQEPGADAQASAPQAPAAGRERTGMPEETDETSTAVNTERGEGTNAGVPAPATAAPTTEQLLTLMQGISAQLGRLQDSQNELKASYAALDERVKDEI
ncbi:hypothetical protein PHMEG_00023060 [Phytophthora megakarya]|uniref:Retrotransposon gag domain-containing protein n=1 Tax=Phytophthora megakarya TaxID=4795 RepID=A0A225VJL7_9STRA|nr:hypothetical protein PHMEG_00023060 [Phytophthora megakarya]